MAVHELKCDPGQFSLIATWNKRFELRKNDRDYQKGDTLILRRTKYSSSEMAQGAPLEYEGKPLRVTVMHVMYPPAYGGLNDGWVIMSISAPWEET